MHWVCGRCDSCLLSFLDCTCHLIHNDFVHEWGFDMKIGYSAKGDRTQNVRVVDKEYVVIKWIQTLGGSGDETTKVFNCGRPTSSVLIADQRVEIRRQLTWKLQVFKDLWYQSHLELIVTRVF